MKREERSGGSWYNTYMLYVFCGDNFKAREESKKYVEACRKKRPNAEYIYFSQNAQEHSLEELLISQGLFDNKYIVFCDEVLETEYSKHLLNNLKEYKKSSHMFIIFEPDLKKEAELKKVGAIIKKSKKETKSTDSKNVFAFMNVFVKNDPKKTLAAFSPMKKESEAILNIMLWQIRAFVATAKSSSASESGLKPFVYTKSKSALKNFNDPFELLLTAEKSVRDGRLSGLSEEQIIEDIVLSAHQGSNLGPPA